MCLVLMWCMSLCILFVVWLPLKSADKTTVGIISLQFLANCEAFHCIENVKTLVIVLVHHIWFCSVCKIIYVH